MLFGRNNWRGRQGPHRCTLMCSLTLYTLSPDKVFMVLWLLRNNTPAAGRRKSARVKRAHEHGCVRKPMSTKHPTPDKGSTAEQFVPVSQPAPMTSEKLAACRQPQRNLFEAATANECVVFAVAHRHGAAQDHEQHHERAAHAVLYLTADGGRVVERWVTGPAGDLSAVARATIVPVDALVAADKHAKRFAPVVQRHPEL